MNAMVRQIIPVLFLFLVFATQSFAQELALPIIDMHLHATTAGANGPPPTAICAPMAEMPVHDPSKSLSGEFLKMIKEPPCPNPIWGPKTDKELMDQTLEVLKRRNIYAVASGRPEFVDQWKQVGGERIIPALIFGNMDGSTPSPAEVRKWFTEKRFKVFGEVTIQYDGMLPTDPKFEPYLAIAEELDIPMGIHIGTGPPGAPYLPGSPKYRARMHSPLVLEDALVRHPKLRVYIMHAGWPMIDDLLAVLYVHPQVHIDVGVISYILPRKEFHRYLRIIVEAGFGKRVMFGSDQMNWPGAIDVAIESIESADFLTKEQKRDIFYNNAARFLRLSEDEIARHHGKAAQKVVSRPSNFVEFTAKIRI